MGKTWKGWRVGRDRRGEVEMGRGEMQVENEWKVGMRGVGRELGRERDRTRAREQGRTFGRGH